MNDKLKSALVAYLKSEGRNVDAERGVTVDFYAEAGGCSCEEATANLEISYYQADERWRSSHSIDSYDVEDFLAFVVEHKGE